ETVSGWREAAVRRGRGGGTGESSFFSDFVDGLDDVFLDRRSPERGESVVDVGAAAFVAAFVEDAARGNVGHDVVAVAGHPGGGAAAFFLQAKREVDHHFSAEKDEVYRVPQIPDPDGIRVGTFQSALFLQLADEKFGAG